MFQWRVCHSSNRYIPRKGIGNYIWSAGWVRKCWAELLYDQVPAHEPTAKVSSLEEGGNGCVVSVDSYRIA